MPWTKSACYTLNVLKSFVRHKGFQKQKVKVVFVLQYSECIFCAPNIYSKYTLLEISWTNQAIFKLINSKKNTPQTQ